MSDGRWSDRSADSAKHWSDVVAGLAADALIHARLIRREDFDAAAEVISEEIFARLCLRDLPPTDESRLSPPDA